MLHTESRGSCRRGTSTRVKQAKLQALQIVFTRALLMFSVGEKPKGWTQKAFFPPGPHQYAAIPDTTLLSLPGYAAPHPFCSFPSVLAHPPEAFHD